MPTAIAMPFCEIEDGMPDLMAFLVGFFDESGKWKDHNVISFSGLAADNDHWEAFHYDWQYALRHTGITKLHMSDGALNFRRALSAKRPAIGVEERLQALSTFIRIMREHLEYGVAFALDVPAFNSLKSEQKRTLGQDPHLLVFKSAMIDMKDYAEQTQSTLGVLCDDEEKYSVECYKLFSRLRTSDRSIRKTIVSFGFADDNYFDQLQAADLLAYITRREAAHRFQGKTFESRNLYEELLNSIPSDRLKLASYFWNKEAMEIHANGVPI